MKRMIYSATAACLIATSALAAASTPRIEAGWVRATPPAARAGAARRAGTRQRPPKKSGKALLLCHG